MNDYAEKMHAKIDSLKAELETSRGECAELQKQLGSCMTDRENLRAEVSFFKDVIAEASLLLEQSANPLDAACVKLNNLLK